MLLQSHKKKIVQNIRLFPFTNHEKLMMLPKLICAMYVIEEFELIHNNFTTIHNGHVCIWGCGVPNFAFQKVEVM